VALVGDLLYIVQSMNISSDASADIDLLVAEHGSEIRVVTVVGQIDTPAALELANSLVTQLAVARVVVVDLDRVSFLGSAGLSALFEANELATQQDRALRLVCNSPIVNWALAATGLWEYFIFADTIPGALKSPAYRQSGDDVAVARRRSRSRRSRRRDSRLLVARISSSDLMP
jgi:anti-sigma B factor antagonist